MKETMNRASMLCLLAGLAHMGVAKEFHVSIKGNDANEGSRGKPFRTISAAARVAQPGDVITVHEGTYRERINPPRGGESDPSALSTRRPKARRSRSKAPRSSRTG